MCDLTPASLHLADAVGVEVGRLLGRPVLPGRAKATRYFGDTAWHHDSSHAIASVGCVAYLDAVTAGTGALRVVPGSHRWANERQCPTTPATPVVVLDTVPGDVIVFDERLLHSSVGGTERLQWRVDFVIDPVTPFEEDAVCAWYQQSLPDERSDVGYDASRYPSFGPDWIERYPEISRRLRELGVLTRTRSTTSWSGRPSGWSAPKVGDG